MSFYNFLIGGLLFLVRKKKWLQKAGSLTALGLALWGASRFGVEFYRGDIVRGVNICLGLSRGQLAGMVAVAVGTLKLLLSRWQSGERSEPPVGQPD